MGKPLHSATLPLKGYVVFAINGRAPTVYHHFFVTAEREAARLARKHPGQTFMVCDIRATYSVNPVVPPVNVTHADGATAQLGT